MTEQNPMEDTSSRGTITIPVPSFDNVVLLTSSGSSYAFLEIDRGFIEHECGDMIKALVKQLDEAAEKQEISNRGQNRQADPEKEVSSELTGQPWEKNQTTKSKSEN